MEITRINAVYFSELGENDVVLCILDPSIDGKEYVKSLNEKIEPYNKDIEAYRTKRDALHILYGLNRSFEDVTGSERLNEREPKYPAQKPKGFKSVQEACPEITVERERRRVVNQANYKIYHDFMADADEKVENDLKPFIDELLDKWPEFKSWIKSDWEKTIYNKFELRSFNYLKNI